MEEPKLVELVQIAGVKDLPKIQRNLFALALKKEALGLREEALEHLERAISEGEREEPIPASR